MQNFKPRRSIRWKLAAAFTAVACFVAAFVGVVIAIHFQTVERAAQLEAEHVAELIADAATENNSFRPRLQEYVARLHSLRERDVVILDAAKKGLADADPDEVGKTYDHDPDNEVGKTISDGRTRTFIERNDAHPYGARQIVVPLRPSASDSSKPALGAVILEYTTIREELFAAQRERLYLITSAGIVVVLLVTFFGFGIARRIGQPLRDLKSSVERIAAQDYGARVAVTSRDEIGILGSAFNKMAEDLNASHAALELRNTQLAVRHGEIVALGEMTNSLQACLNVDEAAAVAKRFCAAAFPDDCGAIYVFRASRNYLDAIATWGAGRASQSFPPDDCWALRRGQAHSMIDAAKDARCTHVHSDAKAAAGYFCVPMSAQGNVLGLVHLEFGPGHANEQADRLRLLSALADQLALALSNLILRDSLRDQSIRDHLTGLHNRRFLEESLAREVARAKRTRQPLAVLMIDADHFKHFNDQFGHESGDMVLSALGKTIKASCRSSDLACRFGGEEFTVVLGDATGDAAMQWAERLLARVRELEVKTGTQSLGRITISAGVASYPEHGSDVETLLRAADAALYQAKRSGRDRVVGYEDNAVAVTA